jgi:uncharacterized protein YhaN
LRIIELHIYGYGKLENYQISSLNRLQVFYGENEAGKSTIMSFIHSILFGFPAKQSPELRYEPKDHSKYGGKMKAAFPEVGVAVIERVKGKAAGDVTVSLEDGTIGGEGLLKDLLRRMDKSIFQAIFSFNVHGLQDIHAMKGDELGRYLFSAGALGTDKLFNAESSLQKEMDQRFKPGGKKPLLNEKLKQLKEAQAALKAAEVQNDRYSQLLSEKEDNEDNIVQLTAEITELEKRNGKLKDLKRNEQQVIEEAGLSKRLDENGPLFFPQDGLARFENINHQLKPIQARVTWIKEKMLTLMEELEACQHNSELLDMETEIAARIENLPLNDQLKQEKRLLELKIEEFAQQISQINENLHTTFDDKNIEEINTSIFVKEQAEMLQHQQQRLNERKLELESAFEDEKALLVELEASAAAVEKDLLPEEQRSRLAEEMAVFENRAYHQSELEQVRDQINAHNVRAKTEESRRSSQKKRDGYQLVLLVVILLTVFIWGFINSQWLLAGAGIVGLLVLSAIYLKSFRSSGGMNEDEVLSELLKREHFLTELIDKQPAGNVFAIKNLLLKDEELQQRKREFEIKIQQQTIRYEKVIDQFEKWEAEEVVIKEKKTTLIVELGLKETAGPMKIFDAYLLIEKQKQCFRDRKRTKERLKAVTEGLTELDNGLLMLAERFLQNHNLSTVETAALLKKKLREAIEQSAKSHEIRLKLSELNEEHAVLAKDLLVLSTERENLLAQAKAADEDEFRFRANEAEQMKTWSARLVDLQHQLGVAGITAEDRTEILTGPAIEDQLEANDLEVKNKKKQMSSHIDFLAHVKHSMNVLEEGGLYSEMLHSYKQLKHEFEEDAKEWATYAVAKDLLAKTIDRYKIERMPKMLAKAESFLSHLTDGGYVRIIPQTSGSGFLIERKDHALFEANELSQATAEQVYVAIRLALAAVHYERYPFPVIIDDSFVNFDHKRTARIIELLREFSNNQILFFTCHQHILEYFAESEILHLKEKSPKVV